MPLLSEENKYIGLMSEYGFTVYGKYGVYRTIEGEIKKVITSIVITKEGSKEPVYKIKSGNWLTYEENILDQLEEILIYWSYTNDIELYFKTNFLDSVLLNNSYWKLKRYNVKNKETIKEEIVKKQNEILKEENNRIENEIINICNNNNIRYINNNTSIALITYKNKNNKEFKDDFIIEILADIYCNNDKKNYKKPLENEINVLYFNHYSSMYLSTCNAALKEIKELLNNSIDKCINNDFIPELMVNHYMNTIKVTY